jgi:hypothetical protein
MTIKTKLPITRSGLFMCVFNCGLNLYKPA